MSEPYQDNWEYLAAELSHLDLLLGREVAAWREVCRREHENLLRGMYISDGEVEHLLHDGATGREHAAERETRSREEITERRRATLQRGTPLPLARLAHGFGLTPAEEQVVVICLAPEADPRYERLYGYLQDDVSRRRPTVGLALKLLGGTVGRALRARAMFAPEAALFRAQILGFGHDDANAQLVSRGLRLDERVADLLLGTAGLGGAMRACLAPPPPSPGLAALRWPDDLKARLVAVTGRYLRTLPAPPQRLIFNLHGPRGTGRKALAAALCRELDVSLLVLDLREAAVRYPNLEQALPRLFREAILQPSALYVDNPDRLLGEDEPSHSLRRTLARCVDEFSWLTFIGTEAAWAPEGLFKEHTFVGLALPSPDVGARTALWAELTAANEDRGLDVNWPDLAVKFRLTPGQMRAALTAARSAARLRDGATADFTERELYGGCYAQSNQRLGASARKLAPQHSWGDIVLPPDGLAQLREVCAQLRHRRRVYGEWGFDRKVSLSKGLCVLFHGHSGTGKTMAVEVIANELQLEAYKVDLSAIVSKYIGETEKNLSAVFREADSSNAILFFDEADALFGKRSEVKDAHDRYANIEINYLLQRMEEFEGLVILATNLRKNIDEAFFRRMHFAVEFPFPDEERRYQIWRQHFPEAAPVAEDVDFNFLASRLDVAGGNIKNIVVNAAFLAAANSGVINMKHLVHAARREYEKMGRLCTEAEFSPYHALLGAH